MEGRSRRRRRNPDTLKPKARLIALRLGLASAIAFAVRRRLGTALGMVEGGGGTEIDDGIVGIVLPGRTRHERNDNTEGTERVFHGKFL